MCDPLYYDWAPTESVDAKDEESDSVEATCVHRIVPGQLAVLGPRERGAAEAEGYVVAVREAAGDVLEDILVPPCLSDLPRLHFPFRAASVAAHGARWPLVVSLSQARALTRQGLEGIVKEAGHPTHKQPNAAKQCILRLNYMLKSCNLFPLILINKNSLVTKPPRGF